MEVIYILLSISILIAASFLIAFIWSVKKGQYEDMTSPSIRILYENDNEPSSMNNKSETQKTNNYGKQQQ